MLPRRTFKISALAGRASNQENIGSLHCQQPVLKGPRARGKLYRLTMDIGIYQKGAILEQSVLSIMQQLP